MNLIDVFKFPFTLYSTTRRDISETIPNRIFEFKTQDIHDKTTKEEIFISSKMYFDNIMVKYKNYIFNGGSITNSTYKLYVALREEDELNFKHIYNIIHETADDRISWEHKYEENTTIEGTFCIGIDVGVYVYPENEYDSEEDVEEYKFKQTIPQAECIVCYENSPNILYTNCMHYAVCHTCDKKGNFSKCPVCRKKIKSGRILFS